MDIKEVLNLPIDTEVKSGDSIFVVEDHYGSKVLTREGAPAPMNVSLDVVNADYELVRKKLTFFEAMRLADEGKVVSNDRYPIYNYKKVNGVPKIKKTDGDYETLSISYKELEANWYEVIE